MDISQKITALQKLIEGSKSFDKDHRENPSFKSWKLSSERMLSKIFGQNSIELSEFRKLRFYKLLNSMTIGRNYAPEHGEAFKSDLKSALMTFENYIEEFKEEEILNNSIENDKMNSLNKHTFTLLKSNGKEIKDVKGDIQKKKVFVKDANIPIEADDFIIQELPNGNIEKRKVVSVYSTGKNQYASAAYECDLEVIGQQTKNTNQIVYNIHNADKVNINSNDNSTNNTTITPNEVFDKIQDIIKTQIDNNENLLKSLEDLKSSKGKPSFTHKYQAFINAAASHMTLIAPFIPALTQMM